MTKEPTKADDKLVTPTPTSPAPTPETAKPVDQPAEKRAEKSADPMPVKPVEAPRPVTPPVAEKPAEKPVEKPTVAPATKPTPAPAPRRGGFVPLVLGGAIAAGLGAGAMYYALPAMPEAWRPVGMTAPAAPVEPVDTAALEQRAVTAAKDAATAELDQARSRIEALEAKLAALPEGAADAAPDPALREELAALKSLVTEQADQIAALQARPPSSGDSAALEGVSDEAQKMLDDLRQQAKDAQGQITAAQEQAKALMSEAEAAVQRARGQTALANLQAAMQTGAPVAAPVAALSDAGISVPEGLDAVPQLESLRADFPAAARAALAAVAGAEAQDQGVMGRVTSFLKVQTGARTVGGPREGMDADAILSRAEAALVAGDVAGSLSEVATLPEPGQTAMADWTTRAQAWVAAREAVAKIAETLN
ncbi:hypothetical protein ACEYYB_05680 [Paracoccus sp. p4-l81]|uniref:hypothetical protein n=1 Tax=Paracoccus sp. p4-l81 TaxID=3342806 RepID=UPI0035B70841